MIKLNARELREVEEQQVQEELKKIKRHPIYFILENVYDTYNIGGLFRLADAIGVSKMYICGQTEIPPNPKIKKASIGTYKVVPWVYKKTAKEAVEEIQRSTLSIKLPDTNKETLDVGRLTLSLKIIAIEQSPKSIPYTKADYSFPVAFIVGNETYGVLPETLGLADQIVEIPMWGVNRSLNVIVSAAIVGYWVMSQLKS
jgi:tRNA G18 (ribose-2'-O)-methylase SpoU